MLRSSPALPRLRFVALSLFGAVATAAFGQTLTTFTFESSTFTGLGTHSVNYSEGTDTLQMFTQTSNIYTETISGVEAGATAIHFGDTLPENAAYFNLSTLGHFDLFSFAFINEAGTDQTITVGTDRGSESVLVPYNAMNPNAAMLFWTSFTSNPSIFQDIAYFNITNYTSGATYAVDNVRIAPAMPEPSSCALVAGLGVLGLVGLRRRTHTT